MSTGPQGLRPVLVAAPVLLGVLLGALFTAGGTASAAGDNRVRIVDPSFPARQAHVDAYGRLTTKADVTGSVTSYLASQGAPFHLDSIDGSDFIFGQNPSSTSVVVGPTTETLRVTSILFTHSALAAVPTAVEAPSSIYVSLTAVPGTTEQQCLAVGPDSSAAVTLASVTLGERRSTNSLQLTYPVPRVLSPASMGAARWCLISFAVPDKTSNVFDVASVGVDGTASSPITVPASFRARFIKIATAVHQRGAVKKTTSVGR